MKIEVNLYTSSLHEPVGGPPCEGHYVKKIELPYRPPEGITLYLKIAGGEVYDFSVTSQRWEEDHPEIDLILDVVSGRNFLVNPDGRLDELSADAGWTFEPSAV